MEGKIMVREIREHFLKVTALGIKPAPKLVTGGWADDG